MDHFLDQQHQPSTSTAQNESEKPATVFEYVDENGQTVLIEASSSSIYVDEEGNTVIYTDLDGQEVVQEEIVEIEETPRKTNKNPIGYPKSTVLLTNQCLEAKRASLIAKSGSAKRKPEKETEQNILSTENVSVLNKNLPGMKNMFKVMAESAMSKVNLKTAGIPEELRKELPKAEERIELDDDRAGTPPCLEKEIDEIESIEYFADHPIYSKSVIDFKMACEILIGSKDVPSNRLCKSVPNEFKGTGTFVIDLEDGRGWEYNKRNTHLNDNNGRWATAQGKVRYYKENQQNNLVRADNGKGELNDWAMGVYTYKVILRKYDNEDTRRSIESGQGMFQKKIYSATLANGENVNKIIITYSWIGGKSWNYLEKPRKVWGNNVGLPQVASAFFEGFTLYSHEVIDFNQVAAILLGGLIVEQNKVCSAIPLGYRQTGTFVIDMKRMKYGHLELRKDDNGLWGKPSGQNRFYKFAENGDAVRVDKGGKLTDDIDYDVKLSCKRYEHPQVDKKFVRKIYVAKGKDESLTFDGSPELGIIVYYWKGDPIPFTPIYKQNDVCDPRKNIVGDEDDDEFVVTESASDIIQPRKRARIEDASQSVETVGEVHDDFRNVKLELLRREIENQDRFSSILDRADNILSRLEQRFPHEEHVIVEGTPIYHNIEGEEVVIEQFSDSFLEHSDS
ncbi:unnamed protein product [Caenorhabditis angaria]|uniref:Uncharacterized protein n=1 Tax=Caenorhabditis angaria TaxID=860376 RepID=A0A9P1IZ93_9PELO|nr:unnamed protein product [Caenorhabditis angaria]